MKPKVLIVDDQLAVFKAIKMFLGTAYDISYQGNGQGALNELSAGNVPDLILADIKMPQMDGYSLLSTIRRNQCFNQIPVLMISNLDAGKERPKCIREGATDYLEKPFHGNELKTKVNSCLGWSVVAK